MSNEVGSPSDRGSVTSPSRGIGLTFATLAGSRLPGARELLLGALDAFDADIRFAATQAILKHPRSSDVPHLIDAFHKLAPEAAEELIDRADEWGFALRRALAEGPVSSRRNAVEIVRRSRRTKLAYLLVEALSDRDEETRSRALDGLKQLTEDYRREAERARTAGVGLSRAELETRKYALIDPILTLLGNLSRTQPDELLLLAMELDARTDEMLFTILRSNQDPRSQTLRGLLANSAAPRVISFLLDCLRDRRTADTALSILLRRRDLPFVKGLLAEDRFFTDRRVRRTLSRIRTADLLKETGEAEAPGEPGAPRRDVFSNALLALRAVHLLVLSGVGEKEKRELLEAVREAQFSMFVTGLARNVLEAMDVGRTAEEISLALTHMEGEMGVLGEGVRPREAGAEGTRIEMPELELPWAHPETESLPDDAFTQFFNTFDALDEATKLLAVQVLQRLDAEHLERLREELESLDAKNRLRAVKMVVMFHYERDVEETLLALARDGDRHVRATVVKTLGILEDEPAIRTLLEAVTDVDRRVVANSVEAIEAVGREELLGLVRIFAVHPNNRIRANAVKALWVMDEASAGALLEDMLASDSEMMRLSATWLLGEIDHRRRIEMLTERAETDPSERVRLKALSILGEST